MLIRPKIRQIKYLQANLMREPIICGRLMYPLKDDFAGSDLADTSKVRHAVFRNATALRVAYANWYTYGPSTRETLGANNITVKAALEYGGEIYPLFFNGVRTVTIEPGATVWSDPLMIVVVDGQPIYSRQLVSFTGSGSYPMSYNSGGTVDNAYTQPIYKGVAEGIYNGDRVDASTITGGTGGRGLFGPCAITGITLDDLRGAAAVIGDSIANDSKDQVDGGYLTRALIAQGIPFVKIPLAGEMIASFSDYTQSMLRRQLVLGCTSAIINYGVNDITTRTAVQIEGDMTALYTALRLVGIRPYQCTILPYGTTTDDGLTSENQTKSAYEAVRLAVNAWIRGGCGGLAIPVETADLIECNASGVLTRDGGYWPPAGAAVSSHTCVNGSGGNVTNATHLYVDDTWVYYQHNEKVVKMTSGSANGQIGTVNITSTAGGKWYLGMNGTGITGVTAGDTFDLYNPYTYDCLHPCPRGHIQIAAGLDLAALERG